MAKRKNSDFQTLSVSTFFPKRRRPDELNTSHHHEEEQTADMEVQNDITENERVTLSPTPVSDTDIIATCTHSASPVSDTSEEPEAISTAFQCDIGKLLSDNVVLQQLSREEKYHILSTEPNSDASSYPRTRTSRNGSFRQFQPSWMKSHSWLHYSQFADGAFCRACSLFAPGSISGQELGQFVKYPFKCWKKFTSKADVHASKDYHHRALSTMREFIARYRNPSQSVGAMLDSQVQRTMERNLKIVKSLFKVVILCGKQGLALRGHRDDKVYWEDECDTSNEGNFVQLLRFRAETDQDLADHLSHAPRNATYTSKTVQNELITILGNKIRSDILEEVRSSKFYSVIADEVTDASNKEVLSLVFRYYYDGRIREVFVDFLEVERITGMVLGKTILNWLQMHKISPSDMRGQCYDGAANMAGARSGVRSIVQQVAPKAMYFHCAAHRLNLAVVSACRIPALKNAESYIGEIARFFSFSAKRQRLLDKAIELSSHTSHAQKLKDSCRTRWVERINSYAVFLELLPALHECLQAMVDPNSHSQLGTDWTWDGETVTKANGFLFQLQSPVFLISFQILLQFFQILKEVTVKLQMKAVDVVYAYKTVKRVVTTLQTIRHNSTVEFNQQFSLATQLGKRIHGNEFELTTPRLSTHQAHRSNPPSTSPEDYYRISLYNEFISHVLAELEQRFVNNPSHEIAIGLFYLVPSECIQLDDAIGVPEELTKAVESFKSDLPHPVMFPIEYNNWVREWKDSSNSVPDTLVETLEKCSIISYPNLLVLLKLALTLPITSCESERSFSQLKLIKTARRATMTETRLSSLALMKINRERCNQLSSEEHIMELVKNFSQLHPRRMKLSYMLQD